MEQERLHHPWLSPLAAFSAVQAQLEILPSRPTVAAAAATATQSTEPPREPKFASNLDFPPRLLDLRAAGL
jgi:hypothetical protein